MVDWLPPAKARLWFCENPVRCVSFSQSVFAGPCAVRREAGSVPFAIWLWMNARYWLPSRNSSEFAALLPAMNVSYSMVAEPARPFFVSISTTPLAPRLP